MKFLVTLAFFMFLLLWGLAPDAARHDIWMHLQAIWYLLPIHH